MLCGSLWPGGCVKWGKVGEATLRRKLTAAGADVSAGVIAKSLWAENTPGGVIVKFIDNTPIGHIDNLLAGAHGQTR